MNKSTLKALKGSITKWHEVTYHGRFNWGVEDCPLCEEFYDCTDCTDCPVAGYTKVSLCRGTPYYTYDRNPTRKNAKAELDFLICLLPKGESAEMEDGSIYYWEYE